MHFPRKYVFLNRNQLSVDGISIVRFPTKLAGIGRRNRETPPVLCVARYRRNFVTVNESGH